MLSIRMAEEVEAASSRSTLWLSTPGECFGGIGFPIVMNLLVASGRC